MILLEGPDGGGKTTLAKAICEEFNLEYRRPPEELLHSADGPSAGLVEWWESQMVLPEPDRRLGVYDRCFWISEPIYQMAQVKRDLLIPDPWRFTDGIHDLWAEGPAMIFCMPPMNVQYSNVIQDGRASLKGLENKHLEKINYMYWAFYALWQGSLFEQVTHYDYTHPREPQSIMDWVKGKVHG